MAYGDFSVKTLLQQFSLELEETDNYFASAPAVPLSPFLQEQIVEQVRLATTIGTEKAKSELIIAPLLLEVKRKFPKPMSFFSGVEFSPAPQQGLNGICDFLLSLSPHQLVIETPVIAVVEAKNDNLRSGYGQCIGEMVAAQHFNTEQRTTVHTVYGVCTTGTAWVFLQLIDRKIYVDSREYYIVEPEKIVGILLKMLHDADQEFTAMSENGE